MSLPTMNANQLRWLAEHADGVRGEDMMLVPDETEGLILVPHDDPRAAKGFAHVNTPLTGDGGLKGNVEVDVSFKGQPIDVEGADALFLTQSAVEKFVFPYYTRFKSPQQIGALKNKLFAKNVVCAIHIPPSLTIGMTACVRTYHVDDAGNLVPGPETPEEFERSMRHVDMPTPPIPSGPPA